MSTESSTRTRQKVAPLGRKLVTYTKRQILQFLPSVYILNPVCVVYDVVDEKVNRQHIMDANKRGIKEEEESGIVKPHHKEQKQQLGNIMFTSTAYGTLNEHLLVGEERVTVVFRDNEKVDVEIISYSKPSSSVLGRFVYPFIGKMQNEFFRNELEYIKQCYDNEIKKG